MPARRLDGTALAQQIRTELGDRVARFTQEAGRPPGLGIVLVGDDPASEIYVRNKLKSAVEAGIRADLERLPATASLDDVLALVARLNGSDDHDGILVQSPLPHGRGRGRRAGGVRRHRSGQGRRRLPPGQRRAPRAESRPARALHAVGRHRAARRDPASPIAGARAVVIGRSDIVGKPMALLLLHRHATVTICHSRTRDLAAVAAEADILVAAIGRPAFVTPDVRQARGDRHRCRHQSRDGRRRGQGLFGSGSARMATFEKRGSAARRRRPPGGGGGGRRADAGARRRRPADDCHAHDEHAAGGGIAPRSAEPMRDWETGRGA